MRRSISFSPSNVRAFIVASLPSRCFLGLPFAPQRPPCHPRRLVGDAPVEELLHGLLADASSRQPLKNGSSE